MCQRDGESYEERGREKEGEKEEERESVESWKKSSTRRRETAVPIKLVVRTALSLEKSRAIQTIASICRATCSSEILDACGKIVGLRGNDAAVAVGEEGTRQRNRKRERRREQGREGERERERDRDIYGCGFLAT